MLSLSDFPVEDAVEAFAEFGVEAACLVMTPTGSEKGIMDATKGIRAFLRRHAIHDYDAQAQGEKALPNVGLVTANSVLQRQMSLYRPMTKTGDPRLWVRGDRAAHWTFQDYAKPGNLIAFFVTPSGELYAVNVSDPAIFGTRHTPGTPLNTLLTLDKTDPTAAELRGLLSALALRGYIDAVSSGDNCVGVLLEHLLGIPRNNKKTPDYKGIEVKGARVTDGGRHTSKAVLFGEKPDWDASPMSGLEALDRFGYVGEGAVWRLANTQTARPNPQHMFLRVLDDERVVELVRKAPSEGTTVLFRWSLDVLEARLLEKHPKTFWVSARHRPGATATEAFHYVHAEYTRDPMTANLGPLIAAGKVVLELSFKRTPSGGETNHGYNWRIATHDKHLLFPPAVHYDLAAPPHAHPAGTALTVGPRETNKAANALSNDGRTIGRVDTDRAAAATAPRPSSGDESAGPGPLRLLLVQGPLDAGGADRIVAAVRRLVDGSARVVTAPDEVAAHVGTLLGRTLGVDPEQLPDWSGRAPGEGADGRVIAAFRSLVSAGGTVVVVTSRRGILSVIAEVLDTPADRFWAPATAPGSLTAVEVWKDGSASVAFANRTDHLA